MPVATPSSRPPDSAVAARIVRQARAHFFEHGYSQCTMDELAAELGMSKKTLYQHFSGKDQLMAAVIEAFALEVRADADALIANRQLNFAEKLRGFAEGMVERLTRLNPRLLRDLQRFAPDLHRRLEDLREKNIPYVFNRFVEEGQLDGMVRPDLDTAFAVQFFLQAMRGLLQPAALEQLKLSPRDILPRAIDLFFAGMLTPAGRKEHEKLFPH